MAAFSKSANIINNALNGFLVPENVGFDTTIKRFCGLRPVYVYFNSRHFEYPK
jgi:hypothetical protein